jgi:hypothetical protein
MPKKELQACMFVKTLCCIGAVYRIFGAIGQGGGSFWLPIMIHIKSIHSAQRVPGDAVPCVGHAISRLDTPQRQQ